MKEEKRNRMVENKIASYKHSKSRNIRQSERMMGDNNPSKIKDVREK